MTGLIRIIDEEDGVCRVFGKESVVTGNEVISLSYTAGIFSALVLFFGGGYFGFVFSCGFREFGVMSGTTQRIQSHSQVYRLGRKFPSKTCSAEGDDKVVTPLPLRSASFSVQPATRKDVIMWSDVQYTYI